MTRTSPRTGTMSMAGLHPRDAGRSTVASPLGDARCMQGSLRLWSTPNPGFQSESHLLKPGSRPKAWPPAIALHCTAPWRPSYTSPSTPHISNNSCSCLPRRSAQLRLPNHLRSCTRRRKTVSAEGGLLSLAMASLPMRVSDNGNGQISTSMPPREA